MTISIDDILTTIIRTEGGYVDDPSDPGGATKLGISLRYAHAIGLDLDHDGDVDKDDIKLVTDSIAREVYRTKFFKEPGLDLLPEELQAQILDTSVLSGDPRAVMLLQETINTFISAANRPTHERLHVDGRLGPASYEAARWMVNIYGARATNNELASRREAFLYGLANSNPNRFRKYVVSKDGGLGGWIKRARSFRAV